VSLRPLGRRRLASGVFLHLDRQHLVAEDGSGVRRDVVRHPGGVAILALDGDVVWLVSQRRAPFGRNILEVPAGRLDPIDLNPARAAARELREELGATAGDLLPLGTMLPSPGYSDEVIHLFAAVGVTLAEREPDGFEEEESTLVALQWADLVHSIENGSITDGKTLLAVLLWERRKGER